MSNANTNATLDRAERKATIQSRLHKRATLTRIEARELRAEIETLTVHAESYAVRERHYRIQAAWASYCRTCRVTLGSGQVASHRGYGHRVD